MTALFCFACNDSKTVTVTVTNPLAMERSNEMVEVSMETITNRLGLADTAQIVVLDADGHVLAVSDYEPGSEYVYYWGFAWDKADIKTADAWNRYMADFAQKVRNPLTIKVN